MEKVLEIYYSINNLISNIIINSITTVSTISLIVLVIIIIYILVNILKNIWIYFNKKDVISGKIIMRNQNNIKKVIDKIIDVKKNIDNIIYEDETMLLDIKKINKKDILCLFIESGLFEVVSRFNIKFINNYYNGIANISVDNIFENFNDDIQIKIKQIEITPYIHIKLKIEINNKSDSIKHIYINKKTVKLVTNNGRALKELSLDKNREIDIDINNGGKEEYEFIFDNVLSKIEKFKSIELIMIIKEKKHSKKKKENITLKIEKSIINFYIEKINNETDTIKNILNFKKYIEYNAFGGTIFISMIILLILIFLIEILITDKLLIVILLVLLIIIYYYIYKYLMKINIIMARNIYLKYKVLESYKLNELEKL